MLFETLRSILEIFLRLSTIYRRCPKFSDVYPEVILMFSVTLQNFPKITEKDTKLFRL